MANYMDPNSGGFGSAANPDLSNPWKKQRFEQFKTRQGEFAGVPLNPAEQAVKTATDRQAFNQKLQTEGEQFLGRFKTEFPQILGNIEQQLGLPGLRQNAFQTSELLRRTPEVQTQAAKGFDVNQNQLDRMIASETGKLAPIAQTAVQQAQFAEGEFGRQAERALTPFKTELDLLKDRFSRETTGYSQDAENQLNVLLQKMQQEGQLTIAEMQQATQLAQLEAQKDQFQKTFDAGGFSTVNLGNRVALLDQMGNEIGSLDVGLAPTRGGGSSVGNVSSFADQYF